MAVRNNDLVLGTDPEEGNQLILPGELRDQHLYISGATRTGKSKLLEFLIRQDISAWHEHRCGLLLIDPHGSLYDSLMRWLAWYRPRMPIVPVDLREPRWTVSYNVLREREGGTSVLISSLVDAISYVWGETGTNKTPRFERKVTDLLWALHEKRYTLAESEYLLDPTGKTLRRGITRTLTRRTAKQAWEFADGLSPKEFDEKYESTLHRLGRFDDTEQIRRIFGAGGVSLDFAKALEEGYIVLACTATEGNAVSKRDAKLFSTLLLTDLWHSASARAKSRNPKPFRVWLDEFQTMLSPSIAESLDQAGGYGLHLGLAHQFPRQLVHAGQHGEQVLDSVLVNARSKAVFSMSGVQNLEPLAQELFMGTMDPDRIRREFYSTKVLGYTEETRAVYGNSKGKGSGRGQTAARTQSSAEGLSQSYALDERGERDDYPDSEVDTGSRAHGHSSGSSLNETESESVSEAEVPFLVPEFGQELTHVEPEPIADQLFKAMAVLHGQEQRHFTARISGKRAPQRVRTPEVEATPGNDRRTAEYLGGLYAQWNFIIPADEAESRIELRRAEILALTCAPDDSEPVSFRRVVRAAKEPAK